RKTDRNQTLRRLRVGQSQRNRGAERETRQQFRLAATGPRSPGTHGAGIRGFPASLVITTFTVANAAKIEAHRGQADIIGSTRQRRHHLVVLRAAVLRMRMAYQRETARILLRSTDGGLNRTARAVD